MSKEVLKEFVPRKGQKPNCRTKQTMIGFHMSKKSLQASWRERTGECLDKAFLVHEHLDQSRRSNHTAQSCPLRPDLHVHASHDMAQSGEVLVLDYR